MHKIPLLFRRDEARKYVIPEVNADAKWVLEEPTIAHRKYDGTCVRLDSAGDWWARRQVKVWNGIGDAPAGFILVEHDSHTGKAFGWEHISTSPFYKFWEEAVQLQPMDCDIIDMRYGEYEPGTYELMGPKINGNPEKLMRHRLMPHANAQQLGDIQHLELDLVQDVEQVYAELKRVLYYLPVEGVVFKDRAMDKMAKLRRKDFDFSEEELAESIQESKQRQRATMSKMLTGADNDWSASGIQSTKQERAPDLRRMQNGGNL